MARQAYGRKKSDKRVLRRAGKTPDIHCMMIPAGDETLLLPTSVMMEVLEYSEPSRMDATPPWLLGQIEWESRQVPVFSFDALINGSEVGEVKRRSRIMILKSLADQGRVPFIGLLMNDLPRPVEVNEKEISATGDDKKSLGVFSRVHFDEEEAIIPDMDRLTHLVTHATFGALPITQLED